MSVKYIFLIVLILIPTLLSQFNVKIDTGNVYKHIKGRKIHQLTFSAISNKKDSTL